MQLRFLEYFVTLAREQHFARAAEACHVTQPTLSSGLAALETQLGRRLIVRDRRFVGLTAEGQAILPWAQRMLSDHEELRHAIEAESGALSGEIQLGVIPAAIPAAGYLVRALLAAHPQVKLNLQSLTSRQIEQRLIDYELDAGITYLDNEPLERVRSIALYAERYVLATRADGELARDRQISWRRAATAPLCLLHEGMQNRRILDAHMQALGIAIAPRATADSHIALLSMVRASGLCSILPHSYASLVSPASDIRLIDLVDPPLANQIGVVVLDREPLTAFGLAALAAAREVQMASLFDSKNDR